jgi:hypothetical protein
LRDQGLDVTYKEAIEAIQIANGQAGSAVDLDSFKQLLTHAYREEKVASERRQGFSASDADFLQAIFDKYDVNHNHKLEGIELAKFLEDTNHAPKDAEDQLALRRQLEQVRGGVLGPLSFKHFLALVRLFETKREAQEKSAENEAARSAGLSDEEVRQLKEVFREHAKDSETVATSEVYEILRHGLQLHAGYDAADGQRELKVRSIIASHALNNDIAEGLTFLGFLLVIGDIGLMSWEEQGATISQDPSPLHISNFQIRSISTAVGSITAFMKLQKPGH